MHEQYFWSANDFKERATAPLGIRISDTFTLGVEIGTHLVRALNRE